MNTNNQDENRKSTRSTDGYGAQSKSSAASQSRPHRHFRPHRPAAGNQVRRYYLSDDRPASAGTSAPEIKQGALPDDSGKRLLAALESGENTIKRPQRESAERRHREQHPEHRREHHPEQHREQRPEPRRQSPRPKRRRGGGMRVVLTVMALLLFAVSMATFAYVAGVTAFTTRGVYDSFNSRPAVLSGYRPDGGNPDQSGTAVIPPFDPNASYSGASGSDVSPSDSRALDVPASASDAVFVSSTDLPAPIDNSYTAQLERFLLTAKAGVNEIYSVSRGVYLYSTVAAGSETLDPSVFARREGQAVTIETIPSRELLRTPGCYPLRISSGGHLTNVIVNVVDSTPPDVELGDISAWIGDDIEPKDFVVSASDISPIVLSYSGGEPDMETEGEQEVTFDISDIYGNRCEPVTVRLTLTADTEAPVIQGAKNRTLTIGADVLYKKDITVTDNRDSEADITLTVDSGSVNSTKAGSYNVIYTATDRAGNSSSVTVVFTFITKEQFDLDTELNKYVIKVAASIFKDGMTDPQKVQAIYKWCRGHIGYSGHSTKDNWKNAALRGFKNRAGDCYTYFACAKALLEYCGIPNMDVEKVRTNVSASHHYWNLVDAGTGYYHFDSTPRVGGFDGFMLTDAQLAAYSSSHYDSHRFDASLYPATPEGKFTV